LTNLLPKFGGLVFSGTRCIINSKICYKPNNTKNGKEQRKGKYYITNSSIISQIKTTGGRGSIHSFLTLQRIKPLENLAKQGNIVTWR